jgi:hypothetical protein
MLIKREPAQIHYGWAGFIKTYMRSVRHNLRHLTGVITAFFLYKPDGIPVLILFHLMSGKENRHLYISGKPSGKPVSGSPVRKFPSYPQKSGKITG